MKKTFIGGVGLLLVVTLAFVAMVLGSQPHRKDCGELGFGVDPAAATPTASVEIAGLSGRQVAVARAIYDEGMRRRMPDQGIVVALATASQESSFWVYANDGQGGDLKNDQVGVDKSLALPHDKVGTDHGSVGPFQQQWPWWGSMPDLMDPTRSAGIFYSALSKVPGWQSMPVTVAAQTVQSSAFPSAYADDEDLARQLFTRFNDGAAAGVATTSTVSSTASDLAADCAQLAAAMTCPPTQSPAEAGLTPDALLVLRCVNQQFGPHTYGGLGERATNPESDHPSGRAVDVMIEDWKDPSGINEGQAIADWVRAHQRELGVKYVIWRGRIWNVGDPDWRAYSHPSGATDPTSRHMDHVHVSVYGNKGTGFAQTGSVVWPVPAKLKGTDRHNYADTGPRWASRHTGTDFSVPCGTPVYASHAGTATIDTSQASWAGPNLVKVSVGPAGLTTWYAHMQSATVSNGQVVSAGQQIGTVGQLGNASGCHLHFEVHPRNGDIYEDGVDPSKWLAENVGKAAVGQLGPGWRVASFNALGDSHTRPGGNKPGWASSSVRTVQALTMFAKHDLSVVGLQEFQPPQHRVLRSRAGGRWGLYAINDNAVAWRKDRFRMVTKRRLTIPYFGGHPKTMPVALLENRLTSRRYWVISIHNPANVAGPAGRHRAEAVRRERALVSKLRGTGYPVILTGDFNAVAAPFCALTRGGLMVASAGGTHSGRCVPPPKNPAPVDWIFGSGVGFTGHVVDVSAKGRTSDHPMPVASVSG